MRQNGCTPLFPGPRDPFPYPGPRCPFPYPRPRGPLDDNIYY